MVDMNKAFPSKYLRAADIERPMLVTVAKVAIVTLRQGDKAEQKLVAYFDGLPADLYGKSMIVNKTNATAIANIAGSTETDDWVGTRVVLVSATVEFQGRPVESIRIRKPKPAAKTPPTTSPKTVSKKGPSRLDQAKANVDLERDQDDDPMPVDAVEDDNTPTDDDGIPF